MANQLKYYIIYIVGRERFVELRDAYCHKVTVTNSQTRPPMKRIVPAAQEITASRSRNYGSQK